MAEIEYTKPAEADKWVVFEWANVRSGDTFETLSGKLLNKAPASATIQAEGQFNGAILELRGGLAPASLHRLHDAGGSSVEFADAGLKSLWDRVLFYQPVLSGGGQGTNIDVILCLWF